MVTLNRRLANANLNMTNIKQLKKTIDMYSCE